ncbi:MAG: GWxTD domain-containing protein [Bacteroidetes bacterium]|nr:GWxTD domain-containing protein [Bacteroidota bacterium]
MKNRTILFGILMSLFYMNSFSSDYPRVFFYYCPFNVPDEKPFIETYLTVLGNSLVYRSTENGKFHAGLEITIIFTREDSVVNFKKYTLNSPEIEDTNDTKPNFIDQQRFVLDQGSYGLELRISDIYQDSSRFQYNDTVSFTFDEDSIAFSGIEFIESYKATDRPNILTKSGMDIIPYVSDFYPENISNLTFYAEIYNTLKLFAADESFLVNYYIKSYKSKSIHNTFTQFQKKKPAQVVPVLGTFLIEKLPSGNYELVLEIKNRENKIIGSQKVFFQRSNPSIYIDIGDFINTDAANTFACRITNADTLSDYIMSTLPACDEREAIFARNVVSKGDLVEMQKFFYSFWEKKAPENPEPAWVKYNDRVKAVNHEYGTQTKKGYETDRGRVYLQYGSPNQIIEETHDPSSYPYEIWKYYTLNNQSNVKFLFYNPDIAGSDYTLLHSTLRGEIRTANWDMILHKRNTPQWDQDQYNADPYYGGNVMENWNR